MRQKLHPRLSLEVSHQPPIALPPTARMVSLFASVASVALILLNEGVNAAPCAPVWFDGDLVIKKETAVMPCEVTGSITFEKGLSAYNPDLSWNIKKVGKALCLTNTQLSSLPVFYKLESIGKGKCAGGTDKEDVSMEIYVSRPYCFLRVDFSTFGTFSHWLSNLFTPTPLCNVYTN